MLPSQFTRRERLNKDMERCFWGGRVDEQWGGRGEGRRGPRRGQESGGQLPRLAVGAQREDGPLGPMRVSCAIASCHEEVMGIIVLCCRPSLSLAWKLQFTVLKYLEAPGLQETRNPSTFHYCSDSRTEPTWAEGGRVTQLAEICRGGDGTDKKRKSEQKWNFKQEKLQITD